MKYRRRIFFTDQQKAEILDRWQRGESMSSIGRGFERNSSSIYPLLARTGGIRTAREFLHHMLEAVPCQIHTTLTDNGIHFAEQPRNRNAISSWPTAST